ncbi:hypothetical protein F383_25565 [Gossypium arboreum]|uniref:Uncharacterized protein n=1 Tax=Gossypium arboreum TaxID=29729 RepID=A0A0B0P574_GOSAR|nr:hypothetical protein F383_25565 [Gossypium arboreum]
MRASVGPCWTWHWHKT